MKKIDVKGTIISNDEKWLYDWFEMDSTCPKDIVLPDTNEPIEVHINSGGGDVFAGSEIYTLLKAYEGDVIVKILGIAASAASVIAMAGNTVEISPTAQMMIHNVSSVAQGDHAVLQKESDILKNANSSIASSYQIKTGKTQEELFELMDKETWCNAEQAVEHGFADKIMFIENEEIPKLVASVSSMIPHKVIEKLNNGFPQKPIDIDAIADKVIEKIEAKQNKTTETPTVQGFGRFLF